MKFYVFCDVLFWTFVFFVFGIENLQNKVFLLVLLLFYKIVAELSKNYEIKDGKFNYTIGLFIRETFEYDFSSIKSVRLFSNNTFFNKVLVSVNVHGLFFPLSLYINFDEYENLFDKIMFYKHKNYTDKTFSREKIEFDLIYENKISNIILYGLNNLLYAVYFIIFIAYEIYATEKNFYYVFEQGTVFWVILLVVFFCGLATASNNYLFFTGIFIKTKNDVIRYYNKYNIVGFELKQNLHYQLFERYSGYIYVMDDFSDKIVKKKIILLSTKEEIINAFEKLNKKYCYEKIDSKSKVKDGKLYLTTGKIVCREIVLDLSFVKEVLLENNKLFFKYKEGLKKVANNIDNGTFNIIKKYVERNNLEELKSYNL